MIVILEGILLGTFVHLHLTSMLLIRVLFKEGGVVQIPHLCLDLLYSISHLHEGRGCSWNIALDVKKGAISVDLDDSLAQHGSGVVTEATRHFLSFEDLSRELGVTDGTRKSMSFTVTMRVLLRSEVPLFNCTLETFTLGDRLYIDKLANLEVTRSQTVANRQEVLRGHLEFTEVSLRGQVVLEQVADLRFLHLGDVLLADTDLDSIDAVFLLCFDLRDLAPVKLHNSAGSQLSPLVPNVSHTDLVAHNSASLAQSVSWFTGCHGELGIDFLFETLESLDVVLYTVFLRLDHCLVVNSSLLRL